MLVRRRCVLSLRCARDTQGTDARAGNGRGGMMATPRKPKLTLRRVQRRVEIEIAANSQGKYGRGLASEGYAGGYRDALEDVMLFMRGVKPSRRGYWEE